MKINYTLVAPNAQPLTKAHPDDAGYDLRARTTQTIQPGERTLIGTGVAVKFPAGTVGMVHSRSGLALKGIAVANAPGGSRCGIHRRNRRNPRKPQQNTVCGA